MNLSSAEKALILELSRNPIFIELLERISTETRGVPKWSKKGDNEIAKVHAWICDSGFVEGRDYVLKLLRNDNE